MSESRARALAHVVTFPEPPRGIGQVSAISGLTEASALDAIESGPVTAAAGDSGAQFPPPQGLLTVVGTGITAVTHMTTEAIAHIKLADKVLFLVADPLIAFYIESLNPSAESLFPFYSADKDRSVTYEEIIRHTLSFVRGGARVCLALYGHPSVFAYPGREAVRRLRQVGGNAGLLPAISAQDCLFADLGIDPGASGCQSFEATDFLVYRRGFDPTSQLILWQIGVIGVQTMPTERCNRRGLEVLVAALRSHYDSDHQVTIYEAPQLALCAPKVVQCRLDELPSADVSPISTLYVPPREPKRPDPEVLRSLGILVE